jgi:hypothetical protein
LGTPWRIKRCAAEKSPRLARAAQAESVPSINITQNSRWLQALVSKHTTCRYLRKRCSASMSRSLRQLVANFFPHDDAS